MCEQNFINEKFLWNQMEMLETKNNIVNDNVYGGIISTLNKSEHQNGSIKTMQASQKQIYKKKKNRMEEQGLSNISLTYMYLVF